jgi:hypothetical protein
MSAGSTAGKVSMAAKRKASKAAKATNGGGGGRGSKEAIAKRRTARQLNTLLTGGARTTDRLDGRTEKRRRRLVKELKEGKRGKPLKPIDMVTYVNELFEIGETLASLRKQGVKPRRTELTPEVVAVAKAAQEAYGFRPEAWKMLGIDLPATKGSAPAGGGKRRRGKATG